MTQNERILAVLEDGRWHDHLSLYRLGCVLHSRISELRRRGHLIECQRDGDFYMYRLVGALGEPESSPNEERAVSPAARRFTEGTDPYPTPGGTTTDGIQAAVPTSGPSIHEQLVIA